MTKKLPPEVKTARSIIRVHDSGKSYEEAGKRHDLSGRDAQILAHKHVEQYAAEQAARKES